MLSPLRSTAGDPGAACSDLWGRAAALPHHAQGMAPTLLHFSLAFKCGRGLPDEPALCSGKTPPPSWCCRDRKRELKPRGFSPHLGFPDLSIHLGLARGRSILPLPSAKRAAWLPWRSRGAGVHTIATQGSHPLCACQLYTWQGPHQLWLLPYSRDKREASSCPSHFPTASLGCLCLGRVRDPSSHPPAAVLDSQAFSSCHLAVVPRPDI